MSLHSQPCFLKYDLVTVFAYLQPFYGNPKGGFSDAQFEIRWDEVPLAAHPLTSTVNLFEHFFYVCSVCPPTRGYDDNYRSRREILASSSGKKQIRA